MSSDDLDEIRKAFFDHVDAYERASEDAPSLFVTLQGSGVDLPSPDSLDDAQLHAKLWEVIHKLALLGVYLENTDHLSDRQLYEELWSDLLREPTVLMPEDPAYRWHLDLVGSGSPEDIELYLKYYAGEPEREDWHRNWPEDPLPEPEKPPYSRDHLLPQAQLGTEEPLM